MADSEKRAASRREWMRLDYLRDPEKYKQRGKDSHTAKRETNLLKMKIYRDANIERVKETNKVWRGKNKERIKENNLRRIGFSIALVCDLHIEQLGLCAICSIPLDSLPDKHRHCDHDHETNEPRGLLCHHCNTGLGLFKDDATMLNKAIEYLRNPPANNLK